MEKPVARPRWQTMVAVGAYPATLACAFALFAALATVWPVAIAAYAAALGAAGMVLLHEAAHPYRRQWRPNASTVRADIAFMLTVQVALPYLLSITIVLGAAGWLAGRGLAAERIWPQHWPLAAQAALLLLAADLPRYWLHRACHRFRPLWRLHAVHHSVAGLYWLNVGRFHPLEKAAQFAVDTLPFALLGVGPDALALYFVFYAANGFYQHSNCAVRLGPLNYLVSGPELHRWHHAANPRQANANYGNNLIVWDILFGTRFLPEGREVGRLGLANRRYPGGFLAQLATPFAVDPDRAGIDQPAPA